MTDSYDMGSLPAPRRRRLRLAASNDVGPVGAVRQASALLDRQSIAAAAGLTFGANRDLYAALGYKRELDVRDYRARYSRGDIAARIVEAYPKATWRGGAELVEDDTPDVVTPFESEWNDLNDRLQVWSLLSRVDVLAGLGRYAILLIGAPGDLATPLENLSSQEDVAYLAPYAEDEAIIETVDEDPASPRFGLPVLYQVQRSSEVQRQRIQFNKRVHYSRILHVADGLTDDRVLGTPRLRKVWNRLDDLEKVVGGGSEAFWLRVHQGMIFNIDPNLSIEQAQVDKLKEEAEEFAHQLRRTLAARGFKVDTTKSDVAPFKTQVDAIMSLISGATGIPQRILLGSERGELASTQDKEAWDERVSDRRRDFAEPTVREFVSRLQDLGALPETPEGYEIRWPELKALTEDQQANIAEKWSKLNAQAGGTVVKPEEIRDLVLGLDPLEEEDLTEDQVAQEQQVTVPPQQEPPPPPEPQEDQQQ